MTDPMPTIESILGFKPEPKRPPIDDLWRGKTAWHMQLIDVLIGHEALGFDYEMSGDLRPGVPS